MKSRFGYVSNSSSSSYVIINWSMLDESKKDMVLHYAEHVRRLWKKNGLPTRGLYGKNDEQIDSRALPDVVPPDDVIDDIQKNVQWQHEHENDFRLVSLAERLDFGVLYENWRFREGEHGVLDMVSDMDNFDMEKWLDYIGGIDYRYTGESWGFFPDERKETFSEEAGR